MTPQEFVAKWRSVNLRERAAVQEHFIDLCMLIGQATPAAADPTGERFTFEAGASKQAGGKGWADVWKRGCFAWEYKGKYADLDKAYQQLLQYRESLQNPPLLIVSDIEQIIIHTNFTNTVKRVIAIRLDDLLTPAGMRNLRAAFYEPESFKAPLTTEQVTQEAAKEFARLAEHLRRWGEDPEQVAHFLIRLLFCLFAEDIDLLPQGLFSRLVKGGRHTPAAFSRQLRQLFAAMSVGGYFGEHTVLHFDGGLFDNATILELDADGLTMLDRATNLDWSAIEPSILGTLFTRGLDPAKRAQLGAQYTSKEDILLIVEPVLMAPLRREWEQVQQKALETASRRDQATGGQRTRLHNELGQLIGAFSQKIASVRVLDPACGSANFLYIALKLLLDLEKAVINFCGVLGLQPAFPQVSPVQLYGIEIDAYAHELAQATVWIGYIQWLHDNGYGVPSEPILKPLNNIKHMDALLAYDAEGKPVEPEWPAADVIIGNPPFLGGQKMRRELGDEYVSNLFRLYGDRISGASDLVCYWFERARQYLVDAKVLRVGLLATQAIRTGKNRLVLERIKESGDIFLAWSDRQWMLDGAAVRISIVGFDLGKETHKSLDDVIVAQISSDLSVSVKATLNRLKENENKENENIGFEGIKKNGPFEVTLAQAKEFFRSDGNPNGRPNSDVVKRWANGQDITDRPESMWIVDFGINTPIEKASEYEKPFEFVSKVVKPSREQSSDMKLKEFWWLFERPRPNMQANLKGLPRFVVTPRVAKHRVFVWLAEGIIPDGRLNVFSRSDDYFLGVLQSKTHLVWVSENAAVHGDGKEGGRPTYNNRTCFETFPFPWPPGQEPTDDPRVLAIAQAAKELVEKRDAWLNPPSLADKELAKRTLTNLYNQRPTWLDLAHKKLDAAVFAAYGWPNALTDEEILSRLLALNLERTSNSKP